MSYSHTAFILLIPAARDSSLIVQDLIKDKYPINPFEKLINVYEMGLWPAGISGNNFLIWHPEVVKNQDVETKGLPVKA